MTSRTPPAGNPAATGIASGSLGTGTAVDEETTIMAVPDAPEATEPPMGAAKAPKTATARAAAPAPSAAAAPAAAAAARAVATSAATTAPAAEPVPAEPRPTVRRDPYRPIGIALAAVLMALVGVVVLSSGGDTPAQIGAPPAATASPGGLVAGDEDDGDNPGNNGNGHGRGNGNGNNGRDDD